MGLFSNFLSQRSSSRVNADKDKAARNKLNQENQVKTANDNRLEQDRKYQDQRIENDRLERIRREEEERRIIRDENDRRLDR